MTLPLSGREAHAMTSNPLRLALFGANCLLAATRRVHVFCTVHVPLHHPFVAAKQMATADHIGRGRLGVNIVCGWNEDEFRMFGVSKKEHDDRYAQGEEW